MDPWAHLRDRYPDLPLPHLPYREAAVNQLWIVVKFLAACHLVYSMQCVMNGLVGGPIRAAIFLDQYC